MLKVESILRLQVAFHTGRSMWCAKCGQDVPAVPSGDDPNAAQCLLCGAEWVLGSDFSQPPGGSVSDVSGQVIRRVEDTYPIEPPPRIAEDGDWQRPAVRSNRPASPGPTSNRAADVPSVVPQIARRSADRRSFNRARSGGACWLLLSLGVALFACGALLIGYSLLGEREELWDLGTPFVLAGQATFLVGLVLQLDVIWQQSRDANRTLQDLDERLGPWKEPSSEPVSQAASAADSITRIHPSTGGIAPPHLALRDLQGRLETIGNQLTGQRS